MNNFIVLAVLLLFVSCASKEQSAQFTADSPHENDHVIPGQEQCLAYRDAIEKLNRSPSAYEKGVYYAYYCK